MIKELLSMLSLGQLPPVALVEKWLGAALTKKLGVINLPPQYWQTDTKINPHTKDLLWAAVLTDDSERFTVAEGILQVEIAAGKYKMNQVGQENSHNTGRKLIDGYLAELLTLCADRDLNELLTAKIQKTIPARVAPAPANPKTLTAKVDGM